MRVDLDEERARRERRFVPIVCTGHARCQLARREVEVSVVHEDERSVTFIDIQPVVRGHMLVVPRSHASYLADLDEEDGAQLFRVGQLAAAALRSSALRCEGVNFFLADGEAAGQEIFHVHLHVFPRFRDDGFGLRLPPDYSIRPRGELDQAAATLREAWPSTSRGQDGDPISGS